MEKSKTQRSKAVQWTVFWLLGIWGGLSFIFLAVEEDPNNPMPICDFFLIKIIAFASLLLCLYVGKKLHRAGYLPKELEEDI